jgi:broad specificity phosphatase PhoE
MAAFDYNCPFILKAPLQEIPQLPTLCTLYVMRHGQTDDNVASIITGQSDSPLTARGLQQASQKGTLLKRYVAVLREVMFVASPLHRACVTMERAREAAGLSVAPYATDQRLMEMDFGAWTRRLEGEDRFEPAGPTAHCNWTLQPPGGESQAMVHARVGEFLKSIAGDTVLVCHARIVCMLRSHILGLSPQETMAFEPPNEGLLILTKDGEQWLK